MNPNVSSSLIHFTDRLEYLKGILKDGFRFSYCREEYPKALVNNIKNQEKKRFYTYQLLSKRKYMQHSFNSNGFFL